MEAGKVRCADCGFLALRRSESRQLIEVEPEYRQSGELPASLVGQVEGRPLCFNGVVQFPDVHHGAYRCPPEQDALTLAAAFHAERSCDRFAQWRPGLSPREHLDLVLIEEQREFHRAEAEQMRKWQEGEGQKRDRSDKKRHQATILAAYVTSVLGAVFGLLAGAISGPLVEGFGHSRPQRPIVPKATKQVVRPAESDAAAVRHQE